MVSRVLLLCLLLLPSLADAAADCADPNALTDTFGTSPNPTTITHTRPSGSEFLAIAFAGHRVGTTARTVDAMTWAGVAMTQVMTFLYQDPIWGQLFYDIDPPSGAQSVTVDWNSDPLTDGLVALVCTGVDQASPIRDQASAGGTSTTAAVTVTSVQASDVVVACVVKDTVEAMTGGGSLTLISEDSTPSEINMACWSQPGSAGGSVSVTWTSSEQWSIHAASIKSAAVPSLGGGELWFP